MSDTTAEGPLDEDLMVEFEGLRRQVAWGLRIGTIEACPQTVTVQRDGGLFEESGWMWFGVHDEERAQLPFYGRYGDLDLSIPSFICRTGELGRFNHQYGDDLQITLVGSYPAADRLPLWIRGLKTILGRLEPMKYQDGFAISVNPVS